MIDDANAKEWVPEWQCPICKAWNLLRDDHVLRCVCGLDFTNEPEQ